MNRRFLLGQIQSSGDCLYATTVARQIKDDFPGCHLTWAIGERYKHVLDGNPHVDAIWIVPVLEGRRLIDSWRIFEKTARDRREKGDFDEIFLTQFYPGGIQRYDGTLRSSIFSGYTGPITVPVNPVLNLLPSEVSRVENFAQQHRLSEYRHVILFECSPLSSQSFLTPTFALEVCRKFLPAHPDTCFILSSHQPIPTSVSGIVDGSALTFRENAGLSHHCSFLLGCSSGISWLMTSESSRKLPTLQLLWRNANYYASFLKDHEKWGLSTDYIIEMQDCSESRVVDCLEAALYESFAAAKQTFHQAPPPDHLMNWGIILELVPEKRWGDLLDFLRHRWRPDLFNRETWVWLFRRLRILLRNQAM